MNYQTVTTCLIALALIQSACGPYSAVEQNNLPLTTHSSQPNIIVLLADDLGYGDLGSYGHPSIRTPQLDRLAQEGQRWTDFYAVAPVCSPSRGALMTGKLPVTSGLYGRGQAVFFPGDAGGIPEQELTIAEALKGAGYDTAIFGKWHLGDASSALPTKHGFDEWLGLPYSNDMDWTIGMPTKEIIKAIKTGSLSLQEAMKTFAERKNLFMNPKLEYWNVPLIRSQQGSKSIIVEQPADQRMLTKRYTSEAVSYIERHAKSSKPFLLYVAYTMPHVPLFRSEEFAHRSKGGRYGDVVEEIDWSVGEIRNALEATGLEKNTLVVFSSDNGPWLLADHHAGSAGLLKQGKGTTYEGGMRVPGIFWWPGTIDPGVVGGIGSIMDIYATALSLAGVDNSAATSNSIDLLPALLGQPSSRDSLPYYRAGKLYAFRKGNYKIHLITEGAYGSGGKYTELEQALLYHLGEDPAEQFDLATRRPAVLADMLAAVKLHKSELKQVDAIFDQN